jgi:hypothetical protein
LQVKQPVCYGYASAFDFHPTLTGMLGAPLVGYQVVQMGKPAQKRLLAPVGMMEALHHEGLPVHSVMRLIEQRTGHEHLGGFKDGIPACFLGPQPLAVSVNLLYGFGHINLQNAATNGFAGRAAHVEGLPSGDSVVGATRYGLAPA